MAKIKKRETCVMCGDPTGRVNGDPLYFGDDGPLCADCLDFMDSKFNQPWPKSTAVKK